MSQPNLPPSDKNIQSSQESNPTQPERASFSAQSITLSLSGPLPHPAFFEQYEQTCPGAADRILTMAEQHQKNQIAMIRAQVLGEIESEKVVGATSHQRMLLGIKVCGAIVLSSLIVAIIAVLAGFDWRGVAAIVSAPALVNIVAIVLGKVINRTEQSNKKAEDT